MSRASLIAPLCIVLACTDGVDDPAGDGTSVSGESSSSAASTASTASGATSEGSSGGDAATSGPDELVVPAEGFWRWNSYGDVVDGCAIYEDTWDTGVTLVLDATETGFSMQPPTSSPTPCPLSNSQFECEPLTSTSLPEPAQMQFNFDGSFSSPAEGSLAFRAMGSCGGPECAAIETMVGHVFPCESTALTEGFLMADVELADEGCDAETTLASQLPNDQSAITVVNDSAQAVKLYGINADGERVGGAVVEAGQSREQISTVSIVNVITNLQDECLGVYVTTEDHGIMTIVENVGG